MAMKTVEIIKSEISAEQRRNPHPPRSKEAKKDYKRSESRIKWLNQCVLYLETFPSEDFLKDQLSKKRRELEVIDSGYSTWKLNTPGAIKSPLQKYNTLMGRTKIKKHIDTLEYLLS